MVSNKEIQEERMKGYFIQAAKEILKSEGIKCISVRNIANQAGYSYATLYNYFKDLNDLIFVCVSDFQKEIEEFVNEKTKKSKKGVENIIKKSISYIDYFLEYPGIFELFYVTNVSDFGSKQNTLDLIGSSLDTICEKDWEIFKKDKKLNIEKIEFLQNQLRFSVISLMLLFLNRRIPKDYKEFKTISENHIKGIFE